MEELINKVVVVDVESPYVFVGTLITVTEKTLTLDHADVHDLRDSNTTRERYLLDSRRDGVRANRHRVYIHQRQVVSVSELDDVIE